MKIYAASVFYVFNLFISFVSLDNKPSSFIVPYTVKCAYSVRAAFAARRLFIRLAICGLRRTTIPNDPRRVRESESAQSFGCTHRDHRSQPLQKSRRRIDVATAA